MADNVSPDFVNEAADEILAAAAQNGDSHAFDTLIRRYVLTVRWRATGFRGSELEPEDLAQEGMIGLIRAIRGYRAGNGASFATFARLCIDRSLLSAVRHIRAKRHIPQASIISISDHDGETGETVNPESVVIARENTRRFEQRLANTLTALERRVLLLYLGGKSYAQIAKRLNRSQKSVDNALGRVRHKLSDFG